MEKGSQATRKTMNTMPSTFIARRSLVVSVPPLKACTAFCTKVFCRNERGWVVGVDGLVTADTALQAKSSSDYHNHCLSRVLTCHFIFSADKSALRICLSRDVPY